MSAFQVVDAHPVLDAILEEHRDALGEHRVGYRNHCLTVYNLVRASGPLDGDEDTAIAIACAFHDLALWTDDRMDYLEPSIDRARAWARVHGHEALVPLVDELILEHHKVTTASLSDRHPLVRRFRDADWSAFTFGWIPLDRFRPHRRAIASAFPDAGFHAFLTRRALRHLRSGGLRDPLPMFRW